MAPPSHLHHQLGSVMTELQALRAAVDAEPGNMTLRMAYADMLAECGDERAEGYRAMWLMGLWAGDEVMRLWALNGERSWRWGNDQNDHWLRRHTAKSPFADGKPIAARWREHEMMPHEWHSMTFAVGNRLKWSTSKWWLYYASREVAEDTAAMAWVRLPLETRERLLAGKVASACPVG